MLLTIRVFAIFVPLLAIIDAVLVTTDVRWAIERSHALNVRTRDEEMPADFLPIKVTESGSTQLDVDDFCQQACGFVLRQYVGRGAHNYGSFYRKLNPNNKQQECLTGLRCMTVTQTHIFIVKNDNWYHVYVPCTRTDPLQTHNPAPPTL